MSQVNRITVLSNTLGVIVASVAIVVLHLVLIPVFVDKLGRTLFGIWEICLLLTGYVQIFDFGFLTGIIKFACEAREQKDHALLGRVVASGTGLLLFFGGFMGGALIIGRYWIISFFDIPPDLQPTALGLLWVTGVMTLPAWGIKVMGAVLQSAFRVKEYKLVQIGMEAFSLGLILLLLYLSVNIIWIKLISMVVVLSAGGVIQVLMIRRYLPDLKFRLRAFSVEQLRRMTPYSLGVFVYGLLGLLAFRVDNIIIGRMLGLSMIAYYVVAAQLHAFLRQFTIVLMGALPAAAFNLGAAKDHRRMQSLLDRSVKYRALIIVPPSVVAMILARDFIQVWMGPDYAWVYGWAILLVASMFSSLFGSAVAVCGALGFNRQRNTILAIQIALNLAISIATAPWLGIGGPILGTAVSSLLFGGFTFYPYYCWLIQARWKNTYIEVWKIIIVHLPLGALGYLATRLIPLESWAALLSFALACCILFYLAVAFIFLGPEERSDLMAVVTILRNGATSILKPFRRASQTNDN